MISSDECLSFSRKFFSISTGLFEVTFFPGAGLLFSLSFYLVVLLPLAVQPGHLLSCLVQYHSFHHFSQPAWWVSPAV